MLRDPAVVALAVLTLAAACSGPNPLFDRTAGLPGDGGADVGGIEAPRADAAPRDGGQASAATAPDLTTGLLGYWTMDDGAGSDRARDQSGRGHEGMLEGLDRNAAWTTGKFGSALLVNASETAGVRIAPSVQLDGIQQFTVAAWVYREEVGRYASVISRQIGNTDGETFGLTFSNDVLSIYLPPSSGRTNVLRATVSTPARRWVHVAASYDGNDLRVYVDGVERGVMGIRIALPATSQPLYLGTNRNSSQVAEPLRGRLDDVLLYGRALPKAAIAALAAGARPAI